MPTGFITTTRQQFSAGRIPCQTIHTTSMTGKLTFQLTVLTVVEENFSIKASTSPVVSIMRISDHLTISSVVSFGAFKLKWRTLVHCSCIIFTSCDNTEWTGRFEVYSVDRSCLASDISVTGTGVRQKYVSKLFTSLANHNNPLAIR